jgi:NADH:ubiquinone oxidoreductase subunit C
MLIDMFGLLLGRFDNNYDVRFVLMTDTMDGYPSRGIASLFHVGSTERARIDVFSNDIDSLLLSLFCTDSYSRRLIHEGNIYYLK